MRKPYISYIETESNKILKEHIRILYLSDIHIHNGMNPKTFKLIKDVGIVKQPDIVIFGGDQLDDTKLVKKDKLKELSDCIRFFGEVLDIPVVITTGNHDQMTKNENTTLRDRLHLSKEEIPVWNNYVNKKWIEVLQAISNTYVLEIISSHTVHFENLGIAIAGPVLPFEHYEEEHESKESFVRRMNEERFDLLDEEYNILSVHTPNAITDDEVQKQLICAEKIDRAYCGHFHGGLFFESWKRFSRGKGFINPQMKLFPSNCSGMKKGCKFPVVISTGITKMNFKGANCIWPMEFVIEDIVNPNYVKRR